MDDTQRARELADKLVDDWYVQDNAIKVTVKQRRELANMIAAALAQARREGMEEAASLCRQAMLFGMAQTISEKAKG